MGADAQDQDIVRLLSKVKAADAEYPQELLAARRKQYLQQMAALSLGFSIDTSTRQTLKSAKPAGSTMTSKLIEATLVVAILAETATVAYFSRDKLANFVQTLVSTEREPETIPSPNSLIPAPVQPTATPSPGRTATLVSSATSANVPTPTIVFNVLEATDALDTTIATEIASTSDPNGNNGNHYGQTPKPERTKENNGGGNDDRPPPSSRPTRQPRPTKTK